MLTGFEARRDSGEKMVNRGIRKIGFKFSLTRYSLRSIWSANGKRELEAKVGDQCTHRLCVRIRLLDIQQLVSCMVFGSHCVTGQLVEILLLLPMNQDASDDDREPVLPLVYVMFPAFKSPADYGEESRRSLLHPVYEASTHTGRYTYTARGRRSAP